MRRIACTFCTTRERATAAHRASGTDRLRTAAQAGPPAWQSTRRLGVHGRSFRRSMAARPTRCMSLGWTTAPVSTTCGTAPPRTAVRLGAARSESRSSPPDSRTRPRVGSCSPTATTTPSRGTALTYTSRGAKVRATAGRAMSGTRFREPSRTRSRLSNSHQLSIPPSETGNYLLERRLRGRRRPGETLFAGLEEARQNALEVAQEADAPPQARTEDAAAVSSRFRQRYLATPRDTS